MLENNKIKIIRFFIAGFVILIGLFFINPSNDILTSTNNIMSEDIEIADTGISTVKLNVGVDLIADSTKQADMTKNTTNLQNAIDKVSEEGGGVVYLPAGTFYFAQGGIAAHGGEDYAIRCRNNVHIKGAGTNENSSKVTILKPYYNNSKADGGMDMFYFNNYADTGYHNTDTVDTKRDVTYTNMNNKVVTLKNQTVYLIDADFSDFIIDGDSSRGGIKACGGTYKTDGKGFMINLFKDCDWDNVVVKNTDATGFGIDCPLNSTMNNCKAINCGKAALQSDGGASGFGIGTGYSNDESIIITNCVAINNKKFGFFFEHQSRFSDKNYPATKSKGFVVSNSIAGGNMYDFGGLKAFDVTFENVKSISGQSSYSNSNFKSVTTSSGSCGYSVITYSNANSIKLNKNTEKICFTMSSVNNYMINTDVTSNVTDITSNVTENKWAINKGIVKLNDQTKYGPTTKLTRFEVINALWKSENMIGTINAKRTTAMDKSANQNYIKNTIGYSDLGATKYANDLDSVIWAYNNGIISKDTKFNPDRICMRSEFITMLYRLAGSPAASGTVPFTDVATNSWYYKAVLWGYQRGIIKGSTTSTFNPNGEISKQEVAIMLYRYNTLGGTYKIVYNLNGGTVTNPTTYNSTSQITLKNPTKNGYTFLGWSGSNGSALSKTVTIKSGTTGDRVYTANWKANLSKIEIKTKPKKLTYYKNDTIDTKGLELNAIYTNSDYEEVTGNYTVSPTNLTNVGTQKITVKYQGKTTSYNVTVKEVTLEDLTIGTPANKLKYYQSEKVDTTGLVLKAKYSNGTTKSITSGFTVSPTTLTSTGTQKIKITYQDKSVSYNVTVSKNDVKSISFKKLPDKTTYYQSEEIETKGLVLKVTYQDGSTKEVDKDFTIDKKIATTIGTETITITYAGKTLKYSITVNELKIEKIEVKTLPIRTEYLKGETYSNNGLVLLIHKNNNFVEEVTTGYTTSIKEGTKLNNLGAQKVTVTYQNLNTSFNIEVSDPNSENLIILSRPDKTNYVVDEKFSSQGLKLKYVDSKGKETIIENGYTLSLKDGSLLSSPGTINIKVTYNKLTVNFDIEVKKVENIRIIDSNIKDEYEIGEEVDDSNIKIEVEYEDGTKEIIEKGYEVDIDDKELDTPGEKNVEIKYGGATEKVDITVEKSKEVEKEVKTKDNKINILVFIIPIGIIILISIFLFFKFKKANKVD